MYVHIIMSYIIIIIIFFKKIDMKTLLFYFSIEIKKITIEL